MSIRKIAEMTGLSTATVSYAINGSRPVSEQSRKKVLEAAKAIGYRPNLAAQFLRTQKSNTIAFVIPTDEGNTNANFFYMDVLVGIQKKLIETGYDIIVSNYALSSEHETSLQAVKVCQKQWVDAVLFVPSSKEACQLEILRAMDVPFVLIDRKVDGSGYSYVGSDNESGAYDAVRLLISEGKKRIGFIGGNLNVSSGAERYSGYLRALADAGFSCGADYAEITQKHSIERGAECARALLERKVDAIFVSDNTLTMGAVIELNRQHISIPDQVSIIGYDNFDWMDLMTPPLTTVKQQAYQMGYVAAEMVMRKLNGMDAEEHITMKTQLILRGSHGKTTKD
jgi:LacI family transcriptional regulator